MSQADFIQYDNILYDLVQINFQGSKCIDNDLKFYPFTYRFISSFIFKSKV